MGDIVVFGWICALREMHWFNSLKTLIYG